MDTNIRYQEAKKGGRLRYGIMEANRICQLRCPGCFMVRRNQLQGGQVPLSTAMRTLDLCCDYIGHELETMDILGGEPLLWPPLKEYIDILLARGIKPWIFTNMLAITPELSSWLFERKINVTGKLNIANPSDPAQLQLQAEMIGSTVEVAKKMIQAIDVFRHVGYRDPLFRVQNLIRKKNLHLIPDYIGFCHMLEIGVDLELMASGEPIGKEYFEQAPAAVELADLFRKLQAIALTLHRVPDHSGYGQRAKFHPEFDQPVKKLLMPHLFGCCPFYDKGLYFAADGHIRACSNSTTILAHVSDPDPIRKAYESDLICNRLQLTQECVGEPCHSCDRWEKCRGGCRATVEGIGDPFGGYLLCPLPLLK